MFKLPAYMVTYAIANPGPHEQQLEQKLASFGTHWKMQPNAWIIASPNKASEITQELTSCLAIGDKVFVAALSGDAGWAGYSDEVSKWLRTAL